MKNYWIDEDLDEVISCSWEHGAIVELYLQMCREVTAEADREMMEIINKELEKYEESLVK